METVSSRPSILIYESISSVGALTERFNRHGISVLGLAGQDGHDGHNHKISAAEIVASAADADAVMGMSSANLSREVLEALPRLKYIVKLGIGYEVIDVDAATELGVIVTNTPVEEEIDAVAEHSVALILACLKRLDYYTRHRMQVTWPPDTAVQAQSLRGKTVGIVGYGRIGKGVAQRLQGWDVRILTYDRVPGDSAWGASAVDLDTLIREADIVTIHASADRNTSPILDRDHLALMKVGAVLVNTARGSLIDQPYLAQMLSSGHLSAAGLDVFDPQPPDHEDPLLRLPNLLATPHSAAWTPSVSPAVQEMGINNALALLSGEFPATIVNPDALRNLRQNRSAAS